MNKFNDIRDIPELIMVGNDKLYEKQPYKEIIIGDKIDGMQRTTNAWEYRRKLNTKK